MFAMWVIAKNTFREIIRDRILYGLIVFAVVLIGMSLVLAQLSYSEQTRISTDFGFTAINIASIIISILIGSTLVSKELEMRTVYTLLVRPISRTQFLFGKFFGLVLVNLTVMLGLSLILGGILFFIDKTWDYDCYVTLYGIFLESLVMISVTIFFANISKPMLAVSYSLGVFFVGRWIESLNYFAERSTSQLLTIGNEVLQRALPNLAKFNWLTYVLVDEQVPVSFILLATSYAVAWIGICVLGAAFIFRKKDFV